MTKNIEELQNDAAYLKALLDGLDVVHDASAGYMAPGQDYVDSVRARGAMSAIIESAILRAEGLIKDLEAFDAHK